MLRAIPISVLILAALVARAGAADVPTTAPSRFALTIYNVPDYAGAVHYVGKPDDDLAIFDPSIDGFGVVRENREIDLLAGDNTIRFSDVASGIDPTTVTFRSLTAPDTTTVLEQNFEYDLITDDRLLQKSLGNQVSVTLGHKKGSHPVAAAIVSGILLSRNPLDIILRTDTGIEVIERDDIEQIVAGTDSAVIVKPTLVWKIHTDRPGRHQVQVTYQTDYVGWRAEYRLTLNHDETAADLGATVSVRNESGLSYPDAELKLVAGNVRRIDNRPSSDRVRNDLIPSDPRPEFQEQSFFDYHLYTLQRTTSLVDQSTKQIELFPAKSGIPVTRSYVYYGAAEKYRTMANSPGYYIPFPRFGTEMNRSVDEYIQLQNSEKNGLGIPLPAGVVSGFRLNPDDHAPEFTGSDRIDHTPKDETLNLRLGVAPDVVGERRQTSFAFDNDKKFITESFAIVLHNHPNTPLNIAVRENLYRFDQWEITQNSDPFDKQDSRTINFPVTVPANGQKTVTYTVHYAWS